MDSKTTARQRLAALGVALTVVCAGAGYWWQQREATSQADDRPGAASSPSGRRFAASNRVQPVTAGVVSRHDLRVVHLAIGNIAALNTAVVRARVEGELRTIRFKEGQRVRAGQLLAEIDPRQFEIQLAQAQGQLMRDQALLRNAQLDLGRYKDLAEREAVARQQLDTQEALVRQLEGTLRIDQAAVDNARLSLSYTKVVAPISGQLGLKLADLGSTLRPSDSAGLVSITQTDPISVVFAVPEALLPRIQPKLLSGEPPVVEAWDREQRRRLAQGTIASTDNAIDAVTGTIRLKAEFPNAHGQLFPNQFVNIRLLLEVQERALAAPVTSIQRGARGSFVYVIKDDGTVTARPVRPGATDGEWIGIQGDVDAGARVVTDGADRLREGSKVEIIARPTRARPEAEPAVDEQVSSRRSAASAPAGSAASATPGKPTPPPAASAPKQRGSTAPTPAVGAERPAWLDRLPPDVQQRFLKMNPEERRAFIEKLKARRRESQGG